MTVQLKNFSETGGQVAALMLTGLKGVTGVTESLTARHTDPLGDEGEHEHTWHVTAYYSSEPFRDGRALKAALRNLLDAFPPVLPRELWAGEDIAKRVLLLPACIGARVWRPEGFEAWAFAERDPDGITFADVRADHEAELEMLRALRSRGTAAEAA